VGVLLFLPLFPVPILPFLLQQLSKSVVAILVVYGTAPAIAAVPCVLRIRFIGEMDVHAELVGFLSDSRPEVCCMTPAVLDSSSASLAFNRFVLLLLPRCG
jgi:hypothetical protein